MPLHDDELLPGIAAQRLPGVGMGDPYELQGTLLDASAPQVGDAVFRHHIVHIVPGDGHRRAGLQLPGDLGNSLFGGRLKGQNAPAVFGVERPIGKAERAASAGELGGTRSRPAL